MHYDLTFRKLTEADNCIFLPEDDKFDMALVAIVENIRTFKGVSTVGFFSNGAVSVDGDITKRRIERPFKASFNGVLG